MEQQLSQSQSSQESVVSSPPKESQTTALRTDVTSSSRIKQGRKRTASDEALSALVPLSKSRTKSSLAPLSSSSSPSSIGRSDSKEGKKEKDELVGQDVEIAIFSLQEHGTAEPIHYRPTLAQGSMGEELNLYTTTRGAAGSTDFVSNLRFELRDLIFLDDDNLGVLLNSSVTRPSDPTVVATGQPAGERVYVHDEQYLVSVPLQSFGRPYQRLPDSEVLSSQQQQQKQTPLSSSNSSDGCVLERLIQLLASTAEDKDPGGSRSIAGTALNIYTLPISRSRRVTQFGDRSAQTEMISPTQALAPAPSTTITSNSQPNTRSIDDRSQSSTSPPQVTSLEPTLAESSGHTFSRIQGIVSAGTATIASARDQDMIGPCHIACNEREKGRVISIHGPSHEGASTLQGAGKITVFEA